MNTYFRNSILSVTILFFSVYSHCQDVKSIAGVTTRILATTIKSMADIVANDKAHFIPLNYSIPLRPELEGPIPKPNPDALKSVLPTSRRSAPNKTETETQKIYSNFLAIWGAYKFFIPGRESAYTPPDNCGDVGTSQIIVTANTRMKIFNKPSFKDNPITTPTGNSTQTPPSTFSVDLNTFFQNSILGVTNISDPHVRFDRLSRRWFIVAIDVDHNVNNYCCIAVSDNDIITNQTNFKFYYFNMSVTGGFTDEFMDYPTLGVDKFALNIGGNMFKNSLSFAGCNLYVVNKDSILSGILKVTAFNHSTTNTDMYSPQGVQNDDPNTSNGYFIGASSTIYSKLVIKRISHSTTIPTISADIPLNTIQTYGPNVVKIPERDSIDANDHRLCAAMIMKNKLTGDVSLWTAQGSLSNAAGAATSLGDRDGIVWYEINSLDIDPIIKQSSRYFDAGTAETSAINYIYPTIATSGQGHSIMGFSAAGKTKYPQANVTGRYRTDPLGTFNAPVDLTNASSRYNPGAARWGDFTQTVVDPLDNMTIWTFTQYADTVNSWGVRAAQLIAPPPSSPKLDTIPVCNTSTIIISGISVNNSEFFDPGKDENGPGFNRLSIKVSGPSTVLISDIKFINKDTLRATFNLPDGTLAGTYVVTVSNPDGQSSSTSFILAATCTKVLITLVDFTGKKIKNGVELDWITMNEQNIKNFILEKSGDSINFQQFISVNAKGTTGSNPTNYSAIDHHPFPNMSYYRLKIFNNDGNFLNSKIIKITTDQKNIALTRLYPNPVTSYLNLEFFTTRNASITADVYDFSGRKMIAESFQLATGLNKKQIRTATLAKGGYIIQFLDMNSTVIDKIKFIKQ